ncbi:MAG: protein-tyrosine phosphatase family protein [Candidatus Solibacter sp.]
MYTELHWIDGYWPGRLSVSARPRGGDWLEEELAHWRASGVDEVISLLEPEEAERLDLRDEESVAMGVGMQFRSFPIVDRSVPASRRETLRLIDQLSAVLSSGKNISIHCRQGIGRTGLVAASLLVNRGLSPGGAFDIISQARGIAVPETDEQREWVALLGAGLSV